VTYVLDTTTVSALMRSDAAVSRRLLDLRPGEIAVPQPVLAEVCYGLARLARSRRRAALEGRLELLLSNLQRLVWTDAVSGSFGAAKAELERKGERVDDFDLAIAAHALAYGGTLVTENRRHFERIRGLQVECWSETGGG
jgi:tRNA(fMet)-specific endonuclease VapC